MIGLSRVKLRIKTDCQQLEMREDEAGKEDEEEEEAREEDESSVSPRPKYSQHDSRDAGERKAIQTYDAVMEEESLASGGETPDAWKRQLAGRSACDKVSDSGSIQFPGDAPPLPWVRFIGFGLGLGEG